MGTVLLVTVVVVGIAGVVTVAHDRGGETVDQVKRTEQTVAECMYEGVDCSGQLQAGGAQSEGAGVSEGDRAAGGDIGDSTNDSGSNAADTRAGSGDGGSSNAGSPSLWDRFGGLVDKAKQTGKNLLDAGKDGVRRLADWAGDKLEGPRRLVSNVKDWLIDTGSKIAHWTVEKLKGIGEWWNSTESDWFRGMLKGIGVGIGVTVLIAVGIFVTVGTGGFGLPAYLALVSAVVGGGVYGGIVGSQAFDWLQAIKWSALSAASVGVLASAGVAAATVIIEATASTAIQTLMNHVIFGESPTVNSLLTTFMLSIISAGVLNYLKHWHPVGRYPKQPVIRKLKQFGTWLRRAEKGKYAPSGLTHRVLRSAKGTGIISTMKSGAKWLYKGAAFLTKKVISTPLKLISGLLSKGKATTADTTE